MYKPVTKLLVRLTAASCVALVICLQLDLQSAAVYSKLLASTAFLGVAISVCALCSLYGKLIFAGLTLSWFGDVFLISTTEQLFLCGLLSFLLAHVAYISAFIVRGINVKWALLSAAPIALVSLGTSDWLAPFISPQLQLPVNVYTAIISLMVICAVAARGAGAPLLVPLGALLFYFSDLSVAALRFVSADLQSYIWGLPFYYAGQLLLALSTQSAADPAQEKQLAA